MQKVHLPKEKCVADKKCRESAQKGAVALFTRKRRGVAHFSGKCKKGGGRWQKVQQQKKQTTTTKKQQQGAKQKWPVQNQASGGV